MGWIGTRSKLIDTLYARGNRYHSDWFSGMNELASYLGITRLEVDLFGNYAK